MAGVSWYAFDFKDYASDTARLSCEAHGAYIQLIADYYNSKQALPDDDFILAAVTKLTVEQWQKHRKVLARYFRIEGGFWHHDRIEQEIRDASDKHAASIAKAKAANAARWSKNGPSPAKTDRKRQPATEKSSKDATSIPGANVNESSSHPDLHKHPLITEGGRSDPPEGDEDLGIGTLVPKDFLPDPRISDRAKFAGMTVPDIDAEVRKFIGLNQANGSLSHDWQGSFAVWIEREIAHRAKATKAEAAKAKPRIEVSNRYEPSEDEIDRALAMFARDNSKWSRQLGPEPGQIGCRVPTELLEKHGIDPKTGMTRRKAS